MSLQDLLYQSKSSDTVNSSGSTDSCSDNGHLPQDVEDGGQESTVTKTNAEKLYPSKIYVHTNASNIDLVQNVINELKTIQFSVSTFDEEKDNNNDDNDLNTNSETNINSNSIRKNSPEGESFSHHFTIKFSDGDEADSCYVKIKDKLPKDHYEMDISYETLSHPGNLYVRWTPTENHEGDDDDEKGEKEDETDNDTNNETSEHKSTSEDSSPNHVITQQDLHELFEKFGELTICKIVYDENNVSKNYGFVNFVLKKSADAATLELNNKLFKGNDFYINRHISKKERLERSELGKFQYTNLYVKNIPDYVTADEISELFGQYGAIESIFLPTTPVEEVDVQDQDQDQDEYKDQEKAPVKLKGFGFINFTNHQDALMAQDSLSNYEIRPGYNLLVTKAQKKNDTNNNQTLPNLNANLMDSFAMDFSGLRMFQQQNSNTSLRNVYHHQGTKSLQMGNLQLLTLPITPISSVPISSQSQQQLLLPQKPANPSYYYSPPIAVPPQTAPLQMYNPILKNGLPIAGPNYQDSNLYIKNLPLNIGDEELEELFNPFGEIVSAKVITSDGVQSKGYGFVCFKLPLQASNALVQMSNYVLDDTHILHVSFAQRKDNRVSSNGIVHHYTQNHFNYLQQRTPAQFPMGMVPDQARQQQQYAAVYPYYFYPPQPHGKTYLPPNLMLSMPPAMVAQQQQQHQKSSKSSPRRYSQFQYQQSLPQLQQQPQPPPIPGMAPPMGISPQLQIHLQLLAAGQLPQVMKSPMMVNYPMDYYGMMMVGNPPMSRAPQTSQNPARKYSNQRLDPYT